MRKIVKCLGEAAALAEVKGRGSRLIEAAANQTPAETRGGATRGSREEEDYFHAVAPEESQNEAEEDVNNFGANVHGLRPGLRGLGPGVRGLVLGVKGLWVLYRASKT